MTAEEALQILERDDSTRRERLDAVESLRALDRILEQLPEVECPACGATIRARMADAQPDPTMARLEPYQDYYDRISIQNAAQALLYQLDRFPDDAQAGRAAVRALREALGEKTS